MANQKSTKKKTTKVKKAPSKRPVSPIGGGQGGFMTANGTTSSSTRG